MNCKYFYLKSVLLCCLALALIFLVSNDVYAIQAIRTPITVSQPDGSQLTILLRGDEFFHYQTTLDGYLIAKNNNGNYNYAKKDNLGQVVDTQIKASDISTRKPEEKRFLASLTTNIDMSLGRNEAIQKRSNSLRTNASTIQRSYPLSGNPKSLVILVNFSDKSFVTSNPITAFTNLLNQEGYSTNGGTGSAKDYFRDNSMGVFNPQFDVVGPYTLPGTMDTYGGNIGGNDKAPRQMVIDACTLAYSDGVDFSQYDTDNDGYVDNVFIYYAGYNEAEGGAANTIWPHRWSLANTNTKFNGKIIYDYACTSELKGTFGSNMCGIGTFVHEFGHVLGLPDFYATNDATHHTLFSWDVMDYGPYLNAGRTPPSYSSYERFFLGWLTPIEITSPQNITLDTLSTSNEAYLITQNGNHNLNGSNPYPVEFFMLENRQKKGWDKYLPGHGMLVTRVYYNSSDWYQNTVNNTLNSMGVDIIEADGTASNNNCSGDPFPGTSNVTVFDPKLRSGVALDKQLADINESNGKISFQVLKGNFSVNTSPVAINATGITQTSFTANWNSVQYAEKYLIDVFTVTDNDTSYVTGFKHKNIGNVTNYKLSGLNAATAYFYRLQAIANTDTTVYSNVIKTVTLEYTFDMFKPIAVDATDISSKSFTANWIWNSSSFTPDNYFLKVFYKQPNSEIEYNTYGFANSVLPIGWSANTSFYTTTGYYIASPSVYFVSDGNYLQTPTLGRIRTLDFWYRGKSTSITNALLIYTSLDGLNWTLFRTIQPLSNTQGENVSISQAEMPDCSALKFVYSRPGSGYLALDDVKLGTNVLSNVPVIGYDSINVGNVNSYLVEGLKSNTEYYYQVNAYKDGLKTDNSNIIKVQTLQDVTELPTILANYQIIKRTGSIEIIDSKATESYVQIFNIDGRKIFETTFSESVHIPFNQKHGVYVLKINDLAFKVVW